MAEPKSDLVPNRKAAIRPGDLALIRRLAAQGRREGAIARALCVSPATWCRIKDRDPKAAEAFEKGRDDFEQELLGYLRDPQLPPDSEGLSISERIAVMRSRVLTHMFLGKAVLGWRDGGDVATDSSKVNVTISLPAPAPDVDSYRRRVIAEVKAERVPVPEDAD